MGAIDFTVVLSAAALHLALGALWFSPFAFGTRWARRRRGNSGDQYGVAVISSIALAYAIATCVAWTLASQWIDGLKLGMVLGFGVVGAALFPIYVFRDVDREQFLIEAGYLVLGIGAMTCLITVWR